MTPRQRRMSLVAVALLAVGGSVGFALKAFQDNVQYFFSPSEVSAGKAPAGRTFRVGGMVTEGSFKRATGSLEARFVLTDFANSVTVSYTGVLPDLFREGQGVIARGKLNGDLFLAEEVLAKHDENYMPPDVADMLKKKDAAQTAASAATAMTNQPTR